jgi:hypothetical protein
VSENLVLSRNPERKRATEREKLGKCFPHTPTFSSVLFEMKIKNLATASFDIILKILPKVQNMWMQKDAGVPKKSLLQHSGWKKK